MCFSHLYSNVCIITMCDYKQNKRQTSEINLIMFALTDFYSVWFNNIYILYKKKLYIVLLHIIWELFEYDKLYIWL